jgi:hypothetical protein
MIPIALWINQDPIKEEGFKGSTREIEVRKISADPANLYRFLGNNPTSKEDPLGLGVNDPPPCVPYPQCSKSPPSQATTDNLQCLRDCYKKQSCPTPLPQVGTGGSLLWQYLIEHGYAVPELPVWALAALGGPGAWNVGTAIGCWLFCTGDLFIDYGSGIYDK